MSYGRLSQKQRDALTPHILGRRVHDLGAFDLTLSHALINLGASRVIAVDKEPMPRPWNPCVRRQEGYFKEFDLKPDVAFVSWPTNHADEGLLRAVRRARRVVYLGKNTDGTMCAWPGFFQEMLRREVLAYVPERPNSLLIYGGPLRASYRFPTLEERAGLQVEDGVVAYSDD